MAGRLILDRWLGPLAIAASCCGLYGCGHEPTSIVSEYEVDRDAMPGKIVVDMDYLVAAVNSRLGKAGQARVSGNGLVEVALFGKLNTRELEIIERRINTMGVLEFRITASQNFASHRHIIEGAEKLSSEENEFWQGKNKVAEWVPYSVNEFGPVVGGDSRVVKRLAGEIPQALVLTNDGFDVTGEYLNRAFAGIDERGRPQVSFNFNAQGAFKFGQLTGKYIPTASGQKYQLGILLDKRLLSAPSIQSKITSQGRITGTLSKDEVEFIVTILNLGSLPYPIRQVSRKSVAE
jgi:preprotein translocase subunit SecD